MTPRKHLKASLEHYMTSGKTAGDWVKMPGFKFARSRQDGSISETTNALLEMSDEELNEAWTRWVIEEET